MHCNTSSCTYQQHGFQLLPALVVTRQVVEATRVNDLICHVDLLLLDHVAHQALYAVRKHDLLPPCCLPCRWLYAAAGICRACCCCCWCCAGLTAARLEVVRWEGLCLWCWVSHGLQVQHPHLQKQKLSVKSQKDASHCLQDCLRPPVGSQQCAARTTSACCTRHCDKLNTEIVCASQDLQATSTQAAPRDGAFACKPRSAPPWSARYGDYEQ